MSEFDNNQNEEMNEVTNEAVREEANKNQANTIALLCGVGGLVLSILGSILLGVPLALLSLAAGIVGLVYAVKAKKETNQEKGNAGFVCSLIAIIFAVIFAIGCSTCSCGVGCYGCVGTACMVDKAANDLRKLDKDAVENFAKNFSEGLQEELENSGDAN